MGRRDHSRTTRSLRRALPPLRSGLRSGLVLLAWVLLAWVLLVLAPGCASQKYLVKRDVPANPLTVPLQLTSKYGPQLSPRTESLLRRFALLDQYRKDQVQCLEELQTLVEKEPVGELVYAVSELAYIAGVKAEKSGQEAQALDMYGVAVSNAYMYLFASEFDSLRNPYDPQFRGACDLYNEALEATLRLVNSKDQLKPGKSYKVATGKQTYEVATVVKGNLRGEDFERFEFASEYQHEKLAHSGITYGLGVPLIGVRKKQAPDDPREKYYPDGLSLPVTALLRVVGGRPPNARGPIHRYHCVLELHDPLVASDIPLAQRLVPLQTDLSTALAYYLDSDQFQTKNQATYGLINPGKAQHNRGIYMLEPFDPNRIPVLMVHGLWSSPATWMPMFNDLRSFPELRRNYQFWFYHYPTGQPFWMSATQLRADLAELRHTLDRDRRYPALDQMVVVGHSMGGLVSRMQTLESGQEFWRILSDRPFEEVKGKPEDVQNLSQAMFFQPNPSIRRVITIGTPHRGSSYANDTTRWLGRQLIKLPTMMVSTGQSLVKENPGVFRTTELLTTNTSIDSLSPDSPVFPVMLRAPRAPWVTYHNIVGITSKKTLLGKQELRSDGVVDYDSARMDDVASEIIVTAEHQSIHHAPRAILEVRRILLEHLKQLQSNSQIAERYEPESGRHSSSQSSGGIPAVQISTSQSRLGPTRTDPTRTDPALMAPALMDPAATSLWTGNPDALWLERRLGEQNSYSGAVPSISRSSMHDLMSSSPQPAPPKNRPRFVPWLRIPEGETSSRKSGPKAFSLPESR
jgi:pimeloyl-ACP methyl ester carboxylesterase